MNDDDSLTNLEFVFASDTTNRIEELLGETDALMFTNDDVNETVDTSVVNYLVDPSILMDQEWECSSLLQDGSKYAQSGIIATGLRK